MKITVTETVVTVYDVPDAAQLVRVGLPEDPEVLQDHWGDEIATRLPLAAKQLPTTGISIESLSVTERWIDVDAETTPDDEHASRAPVEEERSA